MSLAAVHPPSSSSGTRPYAETVSLNYNCGAQLETYSGGAGNGHCRPSEPVHFPSHPHTLHDELPQPRPVQMLRLTHPRTRSASSAATRTAPKYRTARERAVSTSERSSSLHHFVTLPRGMLPRPALASPVESETEETIGAFSPTSCPRLHLHHLLGTTPKSRKRKQERLRLDFDFAPNPQQNDSSDASPPLSPIPSISRTPSSYSESDYVSTAPSSAGPATPVHSATTSPVVQHKVLRPILEALEDASKFRVRTACASCGKVGSNFPCCPRCGEMWCGRDCRLQSTGGKRHVCKPSDC